MRLGITAALLAFTYGPAIAQETIPVPTVHPAVRICSLVKDATTSVDRNRREVTGPRLVEAIRGLKDLLQMSRTDRMKGPRCDYQIHSKHLDYSPWSDEGVWETIGQLSATASDLKIDLGSVLTVQDRAKIDKLTRKK